MSTYTEFFLDSLASTVQLETLIISHPQFSQTYRIVRNAPDGIQAYILQGSRPILVTFDYYPLRISGLGNKADLDYGIKVDIGDLGTVIPQELSRVTSAGFQTKPVVKYATYSSLDLTAPIFGPITLELTALTTTQEGTSFEARAPKLNNLKTGELMTVERFPTLAGFLE